MKKFIALLALASSTVLAGQINKSAAQLDLLTGGTQNKIQLDTSLAAEYSAGQLSFDDESGTVLVDTVITNVRNNVGQELWIRFYNDTGSTISNGVPVNVAGTESVNNVVKGAVLDASSPITSSVFIGLATHNVPHGTIGFATYIGEVRGFDTSSLAEGGVLFAGTAGELTNTQQKYPSRIVIVGTCVKSHATDGIVLVEATDFTRGTGSKSYSFTQANVGAGTYYIGGYYDESTTDANLTQASTSQTFGSANAAKAAHGFVVFGGAGSVDAGQVGLRITGTSITDGGVRTASDSETLTTNITSVALNQYVETVKKWLGQVTYELYTVSGTPTTYSVDFNYGFAKYEDLGNNDFTVTGVEIVGTCGTSDSGFNIELLHHKETGWTYAATGFVPGNGAIATWSGDMAPEDNLVAGEEFAWKRVNLNTFVDGDSREGIIMRTTATTPNSVQSLDAHITGVIEELVY